MAVDKVFLFVHVTRITLNFTGSQTESVSIRSESIQRLPSELIRVLVIGNSIRISLINWHFLR